MGRSFGSCCGAGRWSGGDFCPEQLEPRVLLSGVDPISPDHALWAIPRGEAVIDGVMDEADWNSAFSLARTVATRPDNGAVVRLMYNDHGLFIGVEATTPSLWADGNGGGSGERWEVASDDSMMFYFDPMGHRSRYFSEVDRVFGVNIANADSPLNGSGVVKRWMYARGDGQGGAVDVIPGGDIAEGVLYHTTVRGSINDPGSADEGWTTEIFLPWHALNMDGPPVHGQTMGMNFDVVFDNEGGPRNFVDNRSGPDRFALPHFVDDHIQGAHSSYHGSLSGLEGPVNYAEVMFLDTRAGDRPAAVTDLSVAHPSPFGAQLRFTAPAGTVGGLGHVSAYEIRVSDAPIVTEADWASAAVLPNAYTPRLRGLPESLRIATLDPGTEYHVAVRAIDGAGVYGGISNSAEFATAPLGDESYRGRIIPSPAGSTLMFENGDPFVPVGDHLGLSWGHTRNLFPGDVWDITNQTFHNFHDTPSFEGPAGPYFAQLEASGVNFMRVFLELPGHHVEGNPDLPRGTYWLESGAGEFNEDMRRFIHNLLEISAQHGIYLLFSPFETWSYPVAFAHEGPWAAEFGGPLSDINDFFQADGVLGIAKNRVQTLVDWVGQSPHADRLIGWEVVNEWDSFEWTRNGEGDGEPGRETEMRRRAVWVDELAAFTREVDPDRLVFNPTIVRDPRGPLARLVFHSRNFDVLAPHFYTTSSEEPINNPDGHRQVMPAVENAQFTAYWLTHRVDNRPIINGEWGFTRHHWPDNRPGYTEQFTAAEDEAIFRTVVWSGFAAGQIGTGLRIPTDELGFNYFLLSDGMRDVQKTFSNFVAGGSLGLDLANFDFGTLSGRIAVESPSGDEVLAWGIADRSQGVAYVLRGLNRGVGMVSGAELVISGLRADQVFDAEFWRTGPGVAAPAATVTGVYSGDGTVRFALPEFDEDLAVKFRARPANFGDFPPTRLESVAVGDHVVTFFLGIDDRPVANILNALTGEAVVIDISAVTNFRARAVDMTAFVTLDGVVNLALTDTERHLWHFRGDLSSGQWSVIDRTAETGAPGMTGHLTTYLPSWGAVHIAGLDARGHAINYWWAADQPGWRHADLTALFGGVPLAGGLTGYVTHWDGLNLAGLTEDREVVVYWWAPDVEATFGVNQWLVEPLTDRLDGPLLQGRLAAYVTPWGGLNIAGIDGSGHVRVYWWAPDRGPGNWTVSDLTQASGGSAIAEGTTAAVSTDGGINIFTIDAADNLHALRWTPVSSGAWTSTNLTLSLGGAGVAYPLAGASAAGLLEVTAGRADAPGVLVGFRLMLDSEQWELGATLFGQ